MRKSFNIKAFTLTELMTVVVILGIIASFALPNYTRAIERAHFRDAMTNLMAVHAANRIFRTENGFFWPNGGAGALTDINTNLRLTIAPNGMTYTCSNTTPDDFTCNAARNPPGWAFTVRVTQNPIDASNPSCISGPACP